MVKNVAGYTSLITRYTRYTLHALSLRDQRPLELMQRCVARSTLATLAFGSRDQNASSEL